MKIRVTPRFDEMEIDIPISDNGKPLFSKSNLTDLFSKKITIYNMIPKTTLVEQHWDRNVVEKCNIQGEYVTQIKGNIPNIVNVKTVYIRDTEHYLSPTEYDSTPKPNDYFTARNGDFIVFDEVFDEVTNATQFTQLQQKYKDNGIRVNNISVNINGMALDNLTITA